MPWIGNEPGESCPICMESFDDSGDVYRTTCGHLFHGKCLKTACNRVETCPICRNNIEGDCDNVNTYMNSRHMVIHGNGSKLGVYFHNRGDILEIPLGDPILVVRRDMMPSMYDNWMKNVDGIAYEGIIYGMPDGYGKNSLIPFPAIEYPIGFFDVGIFQGYAKPYTHGGFDTLLPVNVLDFNTIKRYITSTHSYEYISFAFIKDLVQESWKEKKFTVGPFLFADPSPYIDSWVDHIKSWDKGVEMVVELSADGTEFIPHDPAEDFTDVGGVSVIGYVNGVVLKKKYAYNVERDGIGGGVKRRRKSRKSRKPRKPRKKKKRRILRTRTTRRKQKSRRRKR